MTKTKSSYTKLLALIVSLVLALSLVPMAAFAVGTDSLTTGITTQEDLIDISKASVKKFDDSYAYTGAVITIKPTVTVNDKELTQDTDFTVTIQQDGKDAVFKDFGTYDVTITGIGSYTGTISKQITIVKYFTVYVQQGAAEPKAVKEYNTASDFAALKSTSTDPVSALYWASADKSKPDEAVWNVATAKEYVTLDAVLDAAGIADQWKAGASISYEGGTFSYEQISEMNKFYPAAKSKDSSVEKPAVDAPFVFSLTEYSAPTTDSSDAAAIQTSNVESANNKNTPRVIFGISEDSYKDPTAKTSYVAGRRLWSNVTAITISVPAEDVSATAKVDLNPASAVYTGKAITPKATVKVGDTTLTEGTDYTILYANNTNAGTANATITFTGAYTGTAKATFTIAKAAQTINAKAKISKNAKAKKKKLAKNTTYNIKSLAKVSAKTDVKYAKVGKTGGKKITVNAKTGKVTLKKGLKKATYKIKVKLTAAANANYNAAPAKTVTLTVKVK